MRRFIESLKDKPSTTAVPATLLATKIQGFVVKILRLNEPVAARMVDLMGNSIYGFVEAVESGKPFKAFRICVADGVAFAWTDPVTDDVDPLRGFYDLISFERADKLEEPPICTVSLDVAAIYARERVSNGYVDRAEVPRP